MDELTLPIVYDGEELELPTKMYAYGYMIRVEVLVGRTAVIFEPDEEGSYRALISIEQLEKDKTVSKALLQVIAEAVVNFLKPLNCIINSNV